MLQLQPKRCGDCGRIIPFQIFLRDNPTITAKRAQDLWEDPLIIPYCPECFLNRPEKPYRRRRRYYYNDRLKMRK
ncbi:MAG: hypothetical protein KGD65_10880 [Candidatus Lokiarchaeota archaeon]|nr:hypothetical protein [Candidatus Lokiarchaeota archaeon]